MYREKTIIESSVDDLAKKGIEYIEQEGRNVDTHNGRALQADNVTYVLNDCRNRVLTLRYEKSLRYFARELLAYFYGSLNVDEGKYGLSNASKYWETLVDSNNQINSNYGYYVFHQLTSENKTQLQWIREQFKKNEDTRKALININGIQHKTSTRDFPCTIGMLFRKEGNVLNCDVQSRSTDIATGLPYDMGFFSLVNELLAGLLSNDLSKEIIPGYVAMHSCYTQIYDNKKDLVEIMKESEPKPMKQQMPVIDNPEDFLNDIYNLGKKSPKTKTMKWSIRNAKL